MTANETRTPEEMMLYEKDVENKIAYLTFNRPERLNGPTVAMRQRYAELLWQANVDNDVKVLVIRGAGDNFGSGVDLPEHFESWADDPLGEHGLAEGANVTPPPKDSYRNGYNHGMLYASTRGGCRSLQEFKKVSIVEVKGYCYGWHFYQAADADLVVASDDALFGHAAFRYAGWGPRMWTWIEMIGLRQFEEMVFTGRPFTAQEMRESKFINSLVPRERLEAEVQKYALACARNSPTDRIVIQKAFFEIYKQNRGEYMGALLTSLIESLGPQVRPESGEFVLDQDVLDSGLPAAVREAEKRFPPDWRMSKSGRRAE
jgi:enoyl-CoA hydratase/carnithine racemase